MLDKSFQLGGSHFPGELYNNFLGFIPEIQ